MFSSLVLPYFAHICNSGLRHCQWLHVLALVCKTILKVELNNSMDKFNYTQNNPSPGGHRKDGYTRLSSHCIILCIPSP